MRKTKNPNARPSLVKSRPHRTTSAYYIEGLTDGVVETESRPEANAFNTLILCHDVTRILSQPGPEPYLRDGKVYRYTPDFCVDAFLPNFRIEVKALSFLVQSEESLQKYAAIGKYFQLLEIPFAILTDAQLEFQPRFHNVNLLSRYALARLDTLVIQEAQDALRYGPLSIPGLLSKIEGSLVDIWTLIAQKHICFDWGQELNPETSKVSLPGNPYGGLKLEDVLNSTRHSRLLEELALGRRPTDKRQLADAAAWRCTNRPIEPWSVVGGFRSQKALRNLGPQESFSRVSYKRRNLAPGFRTTAEDSDE